MFGTIDNTLYDLSRNVKDKVCVVIWGTLNHASVGIFVSMTVPNAEVTTAHMRVSCAPPGPTVSKVLKLLLELSLIHI